MALLALIIVIVGEEVPEGGRFVVFRHSLTAPAGGTKEPAEEEDDKQHDADAGKDVEKHAHTASVAKPSRSENLV